MHFCVSCIGCQAFKVNNPQFPLKCEYCVVTVQQPPNLPTLSYQHMNKQQVKSMYPYLFKEEATMREILDQVQPFTPEEHQLFINSILKLIDEDESSHLPTPSQAFEHYLGRFVHPM